MNDHRTWYHGTPLRLDILRAGSTVTPLRALAEVFSQKPSLVCIEDDGTIRHNGTQPGFLYAVTEPLGPDDVYPHPRTTMEPGLEWLTVRDLPLSFIATVEIRAGELLSADDVAGLQRRAGSQAESGPA